MRNRYWLWRKSIRLFVALVVFTDEHEPLLQMRRVAICAVLMTIYDYDTNRMKTADPETSLSFVLLDRLLKGHPYHQDSARLAKELLHADWDNALSRHGLQHGSFALEFCSKIIASHWLTIYSKEEIAAFGRLLQILDDLVDLETDAQHRKANCFLTIDGLVHGQELAEFLGSGFFAQLENRSRAYASFRRICEQKLRHPDFSHQLAIRLSHLSRAC